MSRSGPELAEIVRRYGPAYRGAVGAVLPLEHRRVLAAIEACRTSRWVQARRTELLPVPYFHVVFTLPAPLADLSLQNKRLLYGLLLSAASRTLLTIAADPKHLGARIGFLSVLHTWGQNLLHHPHLHCIVPGGGLSPDRRRWIACRPGFFLPVRVLSRLFRRLFLDGLAAAFRAGRLRFFGSLAYLADPAALAAFTDSLARIEWVVYAKPPSVGPEHVLAYLGRYTHRVALSNSRILSLDDGAVAFRWKDYRHANHQKVMTLDATEFLRRFLLHVLPNGFSRIRHYGLLANRHRARNLALCRALLTPYSPDPPTPEDSRQTVPSDPETPPPPLRLCPVCHQGPLRRRPLLPAQWDTS
ncbi:MAG: transposase [Holophagales bacterium]|nr:transposase [Holophagales bacterium]